MRTIAMCLLTLALCKMALVQHLRMEGARDVIVAAYGQKALAACEARDPAWRLGDVRAADMALQVGDRMRAVALWQVDHAEWPARFRAVRLELRSPEGRICSFDPATGLATEIGPRVTATAGS